eukprot:TRINITY_DN20951_c0_g1_i1.p1 TRINITY_DN20951_c0_g1~~TRINITY_DN20951_c0_g1_i1.p1  ORF type:complete len:166 (-),score=11.70 TRINITY_DN20951_c0_g1_i1:44-541(-)
MIATIKRLFKKWNASEKENRGTFLFYFRTERKLHPELDGYMSTKFAKNMEILLPYFSCSSFLIGMFDYVYKLFELKTPDLLKKLNHFKGQHAAIRRHLKRNTLSFYKPQKQPLRELYVVGKEPGEESFDTKCRTIHCTLSDYALCQFVYAPKWGKRAKQLSLIHI